MPQMILSDRMIASEPFSSEGQRILRDANLKGFFIIIGRRSKTFMIQGDLRKGDQRQSIRIKVGQAGKITTREAKAKAKILLGKISDGQDPRPKSVSKAAKQNDPSLRHAWKNYRDGHMRRKERSEKTICGYADHVERLMKKWLDEPLSSLGDNPGLVRGFHNELTANSGPYMANACMRSLRAIYNHARKSARGLPPENPVFAVDWNPEHRRDTGMGAGDLNSWFAQLRELKNPLRRELYLFLLLSGSRPQVIKSARMEHISFSERLLFVPKPKGGVKKSFSIPLSREMMRSLVRIIRLGRMIFPGHEADWLFPADSASGHIVEHKEARDVLSHWGNDLRQTYRNIGQLAEISEVDMHLLMNHSLLGVNAGYLTRGKLVNDHLRKAQQAISSMIISQIGGDDDQNANIWPHQNSRSFFAPSFARKGWL